MNKQTSLLIAFIFAGIFYSPVHAQTQKGKFINASIGMGLCSSYDQADATGSGFYAQAEYVWNPYTWLGVRPYAGLVTASGESDEKDIEKWSIKSNAALFGVKARLTAPIPYVAPFIEVGAGMSLGSFETYTPYTTIKTSGALFHMPVSLGLALGRKHNYELKFTYYYHDSAEQFSGAAALGFSFPIRNDSE